MERLIVTELSKTYQKRYMVMTYMKRILLLFLSLCLLLTGCGAKYTTTEDAYVPDEDYQFCFGFGSRSNPITESETGYYFVLGDYIHYMDKETLKPIVLCQKPTCKHDKETDPYIVADCNAFMRADWVGYYQGKLYTIARSLSSSGADLIEIYLDGTGRKTLYHFDIEPLNPALHRGNIYYASKAYREDGTSVLALRSVSILSDNIKEQIVYKSELTNGDIFSIQPYGNNVYFTESGYRDEIYIDNNLMYSCIDKETKVLPKSIIQDGVEYRTSQFGFYDDKLLVTGAIPSGESWEYKHWYYDPVDGIYEECFALPSTPYTVRYSDGMNFYEMDGMGEDAYARMFDSNGNQLVTFYVGESDLYLLPGNEHLFVMDSISSYIIAYDKSELVKGIVNPIQVLDVDINDYLKSVITTID